MMTPTSIQTTRFCVATYQYGDPLADRVALLLPGKLDTGAYPHMLGHAAHLASQGRYAISFDPPGTRESAGDIADYCATTYLQAIDELIEHLGNKPTLLVGHSRGGRIAILAGDRNPYVVGTVSMMAGQTLRDGDQPERKKQGYRMSVREHPDPSQPAIKYKLPYSFYADRLEYDLDDVLRRYETPSLFVAGVDDALITPADVYNAYSITAHPKSYAEVASDHDYRKDPHIIRQINHTISGFVETIGRYYQRDDRCFIRHGGGYSIDGRILLYVR